MDVALLGEQFASSPPDAAAGPGDQRDEEVMVHGDYCKENTI